MPIHTILRAVGALLLLFACCYAPAFAVVAYVKPPLSLGVPLIIGISFATAIGLTAIFARRPEGFGEFGFGPCGARNLATAVVLAAPIGWVLDTLVARFAPAASMPEMALPLFLKILYFVVGAAIQEEVIFRGLLQSMFARQVAATFFVFGIELSLAGLAAALLFGLIHLEVNPLTAFAASVLGMLAGELRRKSGSLLPAVIVHAIFNGLSIVT